MKPDSVKIIQFQTEPYTYYESNGSAYKDKVDGRYFFGLGDDGNIYQWVVDYKRYVGKWETVTGWKLITT